MPILPYQGTWPKIAPGVFVAPTAVIVGDVTIEEGASVWFGAVIRGDEAPVTIGRDTNVQDNCVIHVDTGAPCAIGAGGTLGHGAIIHGARLGDGVLVGMRATVLSHAEVGAGAIIAAGAVVPEGRRIEPGMLAMGIPARAVRPVTEAERERAARGVGRYQDFAREYAAAARAAEEGEAAGKGRRKI
ncbi:MAG TPA: gamma carbonic anhydrase family protein [Ktedonobacterales bacterium]|jgi:carbonic anhydrase/acetyltransferase-like protein (isoleucine patch superfamily)